MRKITLKGFMTTYIKSLSYGQTSSITKLARELEHNSRLREPFVLHAILSGMPVSIQKTNPEIYHEYQNILAIASDSSSLLEKKELLPINYQKAIRTYEYFRDKKKNENSTKLLMHKTITLIQHQKNISNYHIYTSLNLNPGNVNCFIKNKNANKLSLNTVRKILNFVKLANNTNKSTTNEPSTI